MYKRVLVFLLAAVFTASYAQAQLTFGARAGFSLTNLSVKDDDGDKLEKDEKPRFLPGFQIGVVADYALSDVLSLQPGIIFATQGAKVGWNDDNDSKIVMSFNYIQVPINLQYKHDLGGMNLLLQAGPYLGYGLSGKMKFWDNEGKRISEEDLKKMGPYVDEDWYKIKFGSDKEKHGAKSLDFGIGLGVGLQFGNLQAGVGYNLGLMNISHQYDGNDNKASLKNNGLAVTLTFLFGN